MSDLLRLLLLTLPPPRPSAISFVPPVGKMAFVKSRRHANLSQKTVEREGGRVRCSLSTRPLCVLISLAKSEGVYVMEENMNFLTSRIFGIQT